MKIVYEYRDDANNLRTDTDLGLIELSDGSILDIQFVDNAVCKYSVTHWTHEFESKKSAMFFPSYQKAMEHVDMMTRTEISGKEVFLIIFAIIVVAFTVWSVLARIERDSARHNEEDKKLMDEGALAARKGLSSTDNPYTYSSEREAWGRGWVNEMTK